MRAFEFLSESILIEKSRGLLYRDPGDRFINPQGREIVFKQLTYMPSKPGAYGTKEELDDAVAQLKQNYPNVVFVNNQDNSMRAAAVLEFEEPKIKGKLYFARFFKQINNDMASQWKNDNLPGNWQLQKAASLKSSYKMKPGDIFSPGAEFTTTQDLFNKLSQSSNGKLLAADASAILKGELPVFKGLAEKESAVRDDFGEVLAPAALIQGLIKTSGSEEAKKILNDNRPWSGTIRFGKGKTQGLTDSYIDLPTGITLGISSKGKDGATASVKNIYDGIIILEKQADQTLLTDNPETISILKVVAQAAAVDGPFKIAQTLEIADVVALESTVKELIKNNPKDFSAYPGDIQQRLKSYTDRLIPKVKPDYNIGYHVLAVIARDMAAAVNKIPNFGETCLKIVNASPLIQIYMNTTKQGDDVSVTGFNALYPPNFKGKIALDATKVYYATGTNGRYTFEFKPTK